MGQLRKLSRAGDKLKVIAGDLVTQVRKSVTINWTVRAVTDAQQRPGFQSARAKIKVVVKRILRKHGYWLPRGPAWSGFALRCAQSMSVDPASIHSPDLQDEATKTVLAQAELLCADWAA